MIKGKFITFEGVDGSGKSTLAKKTVEHFISQGHKVLHTREPGGSPLGEKIRTLIINEEMAPITELLLFFANRYDHYHKHILPHINEGYIVVSERFTDSSYVFQGMAKGVMKQVSMLNKSIMECVKPDKTIIIDVDLKIAKERMSSRGNKDRFESSSDEFHMKVRSTYNYIAKTEPDRCTVIFNDTTVEECLDKILTILTPLLKD